VRRALAAIDQISKLPKNLVGLRDVRLMRQGAETLLSAGAERSKQLQSTHAELEKRFALNDDEEPEALRDHAAALRTSGIFGFMNSSFRAAKRKYRSTLKAHETVPRDRMAVELDQIADLPRNRTLNSMQICARCAAHSLKEFTRRLMI
jgi:hypothetical protein